jgi:hypothetical protein
MPTCLKCRVAFLNGEAHRCGRTRVSVGLWLLVVIVVSHAVLSLTLEKPTLSGVAGVWLLEALR